MSQNDFEELLSAYLDGELAPDEKAFVESRLGESLELREHLAALTEISQQIRMLPRPYAPTEMRTTILDKLGQQTRSIPSSSRSPRPARRFSRSLSEAAQWSGLAVAGLLLLVGTWAILAPQQSVDLAKHEPVLGRPMDKLNSAIAMQAAPVARTLESEASGFSAGSGLSMPTEAADLHVPPAPEVQVVNVTAEEIRRKIGELDQRPRVGNSVLVQTQRKEADGETPIIVEFTVVDVMEAMNQVQVLLQREQVRSRDQRPLLLNQQADNPLTVVTLELEMPAPEMAAVLNEVPAVDAVMFVDNARQLNVASRAESRMSATGLAPAGIATSSQSGTSERLLSTASPPMAPAASPGAVSSDSPSGRSLTRANADFSRNRFSQIEGFPQQRFNFDTLVSPVEPEQPDPRPGSQKMKESAPAQSMVASPPSRRMVNPVDESRASSEASFGAEGQRPARSESANLSRNQAMEKKVEEAPTWEDARRFRAFILLKQQPAPVQQAPQR